MDAQGRGQAGDMDPADQWVLNPNTGSYELRIDPAADAAPGQSSPAGANRSPAPATAEAARRAVPSPSPPADGSPADGSPADRTAAPPGRRSVPDQRGRRAAGKGSSRRKAKPKASGKKKALTWTGGVLAFLLVGGSVTGYLVYQHFNNNIDKVDVGVNNAAVVDGPVNILVIGTDKRDGKGNKGYGDDGSVGHADTTLLFHVSEDRSNATALSIPRDMITDIPECETSQDGVKKTIPGSHKVRFNESLGQEGRDPGCTWRTVEKITGLKVNHFMMADFNAVKKLSSAVDGVEVCLGKDIDDPDSHLKLSKGRHSVQGEEALAFVRTRHSVGFGGDLSRIELQQQFLSSMIRKMKSGGTLTNPSKLYDLADAATKSLTVDTGIGSVTKLTSVAKDLSKVDLKHITFATVPVLDNPEDGPVHKTVILDKAKAEPLFSMVKQDVSLTEVKQKEKQQEKAAKDKQAALLKGPKAAAADVRARVFNGSKKIGAAQATLSWLQNNQGMLRTSNGGNAPGGKKQDTTTLEFAPNQADQARRLADAMGLPASALKQGTQDAAPMAEMKLILGADYKGAGVPIGAPSKAPSGIQKVEADDKNVCAK
ncbi:LCP family protein [Streptomyces sp. NPDC057654]|uniref:LCP family protein n=1 Tax=Streptomyces sp. NPDC057654 TaxID=3346196 RepID=UPI0036B931CC